MSRIAKNPIELPSSVNVSFIKSKLIIEGDKGILELNLHKSVDVKQEDDKLVFYPV